MTFSWHFNNPGRKWYQWTKKKEISLIIEGCNINGTEKSIKLEDDFKNNGQYLEQNIYKMVMILHVYLKKL